MLVSVTCSLGSGIMLVLTATGSMLSHFEEAIAASVLVRVWQTGSFLPSSG